MFDAAIASADPRHALPPCLPEKPRGRCVVVGAGKASAAMAAAVEAAWPDVALSGAVVAPYGHVLPTHRIEVKQASHPVPDANSVGAAERMLHLVGGLGPDDLVLALISGGGSSLLAYPAAGLELADKQAVSRALLRSGATINEMNTVRRRLSGIKGGRLAAAAGRVPLVTLAISDVPGDDPATIASGPTVIGSDDAGAAAEICARYGIALPAQVARALQEPPAQAAAMRPQDFRMIATPAMALAAAAGVAHAEGLVPLILGDALEGESASLGGVMACMARSVRQHGHPVARPGVLLSGGETTVTIGGGKPGRGGRNTEFLLSLAMALRGEAGIWAIAGDTDGIDGTEEAAGALVMPDTLARVNAAGLTARAVLEGHDSYSLFSAIGDLVVTGPTLTNVNDFRAVIVA
jgi:hydroxypyruvate reductase